MSTASPPSVLVRDATADDAPRLTPLLAALGYPAEPATVAARFAWLCAVDPTARVLVAEVDAVVQGFATLHATPTLHRPTIVGRITGIAVADAARHLGVGQRLVEAAEAHFRELGAGRIEVTSGPTHAPAYGFYRHLGYEGAGVRFAKPLAAPGATT